jgi:hypothetical protein
VKRFVVVALSKLDEALDEVLYRPAVVKAFAWVPRWYHCDLARLSIALDKRWEVGWWDEYGPSGVCEACGRRGAFIMLGGWDEDLMGSRTTDDNRFLYDREVCLCGWCHLPPGPSPDSEEELQVALRKARADSIAWRWRWRPN